MLVIVRAAIGRRGTVLEAAIVVAAAAADGTAAVVDADAVGADGMAAAGRAVGTAVAGGTRPWPRIGADLRGFTRIEKS